VSGRLGARAADAGFAAGWSLVRHLPEPVAAAAFRRAADLTWRRRGDGVRQLEANYRRVLGGAATDERLRALGREGMRSYLRYFMEAFRLPTWSERRVVDAMPIDHIERLENGFARGRGVVLALPHMGNWDLAGAAITLRGHPLTTVAERLRPESLYERFLAYRKGLGMEVLPLTGGTTSAFGVMARRLRENRLVCLLSDRDLTASGVPVTFFGETTRMPAGPAALALQTGAALVPVTLAYEGDRMRATLHPEIERPAEGDRRARTVAMTQAVADAFAAGIAKAPHDWHMLQPLWLSDLDAARRARIQEPT
jgi:KDO2-lipid IV(A) lauroyltransferase